MNVDPNEPTVSIKAQMKKRSSRRDQRQNQSNPYENLGQPSRLMQTASQIKAMLVPGSTDYYGIRQRVFTPMCFRDAQALAYCVPLVVESDDFNEASYIQEFTQRALDEGDREKLWRAIFYLVWANPRVQYGEATDGRFKECLTELVQHDDPFAASSLMAIMINERRNRGNENLNSIEPLTPEEIDQVKTWSQLAYSARRKRELLRLVVGGRTLAGRPGRASGRSDRSLYQRRQAVVQCEYRDVAGDNRAAKRGIHARPVTPFDA